jgi:hypothetical protein
MRLLLSSALALFVSGCVTVNGKSLLSMLPGSSAETPQGSGARPGPSTTASPNAPGEVVALEAQPFDVTFTREDVQLTRPLNTVGSCQLGSEVSAEPTVRFSVAKATRLRVRTTTPIVLQRPDLRSYCLDHGEFLELEFAAGTYAVFPKGSSAHPVGTSVQVTQLERAAEAAKAMLAVTVLVVFDGALPENPFTTPALPVGPSVDAKGLLSACTQSASRVQPVTRLEVKTRSTWALESDARLVVQRADGTCLEPKGDWAPGVYSVFAVANDPKKEVTAVTLTVANLERRLAVAEQQAISAPDALPAVFQVPVAPTVNGVRSLCGATTPRPTAIVELKKPLAGTLRFVHAQGATQFVALPLNEVPLNKLCDGTASMRDTLPAGRYALFLSSAAAKTAWVALEPRAKNGSSWDDAWKSSLRTSREVPASVPLAERELLAWYPWYDLAVPESLFLSAPKSLFLTVNADASPVSVGEPVLLVKYGAEFSTVLRVTAEQVSVRTERLADLSGKVTLPAIPELGFDDNRLETWEARAPATLKPRVLAWRAMQSKHSGCFDQYMRQHDPSWGKQNYIIIVSQRKAHEAAAEKKCNSAALDAAWKTLKADIVAERKAQRAKLSSLPARLK